MSSRFLLTQQCSWLSLCCCQLSRNLKSIPYGVAAWAALAASVFTASLQPAHAVGPERILWMAGGHTGSVSSVAFSPDGQTLASGSSDSTIKLWRVSDGKLLQTLTGHANGVWSVAFSPDGQTLASGGFDNTIRLWRVSDGVLRKTLSDHTATVRSVAFSPDGQTIASASEDGSIKLWRVSTGAVLRTLIGHFGGVTSVAFSPDGQTLASGSLDNTIKLWHASTGSVIRTLTGHTGYVESVAFSPDGQTLASGSLDGTAKLWRVSDGVLLQTLSGHTEYVWSVAFSLDGQRLATASNDKTIKLWRVSDGVLLRTVGGHQDGVWSVAFSPGGQLLASGSNDKTVKLWRVSDGSLERQLTAHSGHLSSIAFSPDGQTLASGSEDATVKLWQASNGTLRKTLSGHTQYVTSIAFSPDGQTLASGSGDFTARLWHVSEGTLLQTMTDAAGHVTSVAFSPDGQLLANGSYGGTINLWRVSDGALQQTLFDQAWFVSAVAFSPDGQTLASGSWNGSINLRSLPSGVLVNTLIGHTWVVTSLAFSPDGQTLASASEDMTVNLWRVADGTLLRTLIGHQDYVNCVAFSPDGQILATASNDRTIKFWRVSDGVLLRTLSDDTSILTIAFSPDGALFAWGRADATLVVGSGGEDSPPTTPVVTDAGQYTGDSASLSASWTSSDPETGIVEYHYAIGTSPTDPGSGYVVGWRSPGLATHATETGLTLQNGVTYYWYVKARNGAGMWSAVGVSDGITVDTTPPTTPSVADGGRFTSKATELTASWTSSDPESGIVEYQYAIGTSPADPGSGYVVGWKSAGTATQRTETGLSLQNGVTYYWYVKARNGAGTWSAVGVSNGITVDTTAPTTPSVTDSGRFTSKATELTASWTSSDPESGIAEYQYAIGTSPTDPGSGYVVGWRSPGLATHATETGLTLQNGVTYYWYVKARNGAGMWSAVGVSDGITVDTTAPTTPAVTDGGRFTSKATELTASWTSSDPESGIAEYQYAIGTSPMDPGSGYVVSWKSAGLATEVTETGLTLQSGVTYYWYVKARNGAGTWSAVGVSDGLYVALPVLNPGNGHYYQYVPGWLSWEDAAAEAAGLEYEGLSGHLATVTSQSEWEWLLSHMSEWCPGGFDHLWLGGYQDRAAADYSEPGGGWRWVTGEAWTGAWWRSGEPNNRFYNGDAEDYLTWWHTSLASGWNDFPGYGGIQDPEFHVRGYLVEYDVVDTTAPSMPVVTDGGRFTSRTGELTANWTPSDAGSGIAEYQYAIGTSPTDPGSGYVVSWKSAGLATEVTETGLTLQSGVTYYWYVKARNGYGLWSAVGVSDGITVDLTPPDTLITAGPTNSGLSRIADATFTFSGTDNLATSSELLFQWRLNNSEWSHASADTTVPLMDLPDGVYTFQVRAVDGAGNADPTPASVTWRVLAGPVPPEATGAGRAKLQADGVEVLLTGCVVTASPGQAAVGRAYVESLDRSSGLALVTDVPVVEGQLIEAVGRMGTNDDGERELTEPFVRVIGQVEPLDPVFVTLAGAAGGPFAYNRVTGSGQRGVTDPAGRALNTTGLLVRVSGRVWDVDSNFLYINEGSLPMLAGVRVSREHAPSTIGVNDFVTVTGICSMRRVGLSYQLVIRPRSSSDFQVVTSAEGP
ncbi:MAG: hypothetical protein KatS3mg024_0215 [Armatimonadota bacterium]|nr:MAG: hypothetical protein KatS3mg024_0215 [Armatimonadota bacterium]